MRAKQIERERERGRQRERESHIEKEAETLPRDTQRHICICIQLSGKQRSGVLEAEPCSIACLLVLMLEPTNEQST